MHNKFKMNTQKKENTIHSQMKQQSTEMIPEMSQMLKVAQTLKQQQYRNYRKICLMNEKTGSLSQEIKTINSRNKISENKNSPDVSNGEDRRKD